MLRSSVNWSYVNWKKWAGTNAVESFAVSTIRAEDYKTESLHRSENRNINSHSHSHENLKFDISRKLLKLTIVVADVWNQTLCLIHGLAI
jgi:hypothetical protein